MNKKNILISSIFLGGLLVLIVGISFAIFDYNEISSLNTIDLGRISMSYTEPSNAYVLDNVLPMTNNEGKNQNKYFEFIVTSHATTNESDSIGVTIPYDITISDIEIDEGMSPLQKDAIRIYLTKVNENVETSLMEPTLISSLKASDLVSGSSIVYQVEDVHKNGSTIITSKYRLRAWLDSAFDVTNLRESYQYKFRININSNVKPVSVWPEVGTLAYSILGPNKSKVVSSGEGVNVSTSTESGKPTYYYRGDVKNNCVSFANKTWKIIRINEDRTIRIMLSEGINDNATYAFNVGYGNTPSAKRYEFMYYSNSNENGVMKTVNDWYNTNLLAYQDKIAVSTYCEAAKAKYDTAYTAGNAKMTYIRNYRPTFKCEPDGNGYGLLTAKVGLITLDEALFAIEDYERSNYVEYGKRFHTMSPAGVTADGNYSPFVYYIDDAGKGILAYSAGSSLRVLPVISLNADTLVKDVPFVECPAD